MIPKNIQKPVDQEASVSSNSMMLVISYTEQMPNLIFKKYYQ